MHRLGINQKTGDGVIQWHDQQRKVQTDAAIARANTTTETYIKTLKAEWGAGLRPQRLASPDGASPLCRGRLQDGCLAPAFGRHVRCRSPRHRAHDEQDRRGASGRQPLCRELQPVVRGGCQVADRQDRRRGRRQGPQSHIGQLAACTARPALRPHQRDEADVPGEQFVR